MSAALDAAGAAKADLERQVDERTRALRESEERFRALVMPFAQAVWEADAAGNIVADSPSWRASTGQSPEEWLGEGWADAVHPDDRGEVLRIWREAVGGATPTDAEYRLRGPDGGWCWTNVRAAPLRGPDGTIRKWVGMNLDISDRKRAEEAVRESEEKYRALFDSMDEGYAVVEVALRAPEQR